MKWQLPNIEYSIYKTTTDSFSAMCRRLVGMIPEGRIPLRVVFFGSPADNAQYISQLADISAAVAARYDDRKPVVGYVAQKPLTSVLKMEVTMLVPDSGFDVEYRFAADTPYIVLKNSYWHEIYAGGIIADDLEACVAEQSAEVFRRVKAILDAEGAEIHDIIRQWNYIERIVDFDGELQHYQGFNDARTLFYNATDWLYGYPAATGIGTQVGGIMVEFNALKPMAEVLNIPLDNSLQIAAHAYSPDVLIGAEDKAVTELTTPKFERGRALISDRSALVYISGTAAIRGEKSLVDSDILSQIRVTMENIEFLVSGDNICRAGGCRPNAPKPQYRLLRVYIKNSDDMPVAQQYMNNHYPYVPTSYLLADVCRDELLVEIEGVVTYQN